MKKFNKIIITLFIFVFVLGISISNAQNSDQTLKTSKPLENYFFINGKLGLTNFWGDIHKNANQSLLIRKINWFSNPGPAGQINLGYQFSPVFGSRFNITGGIAKSSDDDTHLVYNGTFADFSSQVTIDIPKFFGAKKDAKLGIFAFGGVGLLFTSSTVVNSVEETFDTSLSIVFPAGIGIKYALAYNIDLIYETGLHYSLTDNLDQQPNENPYFYSMDGIRFSSIGITYKFGIFNGCQKW